MAERVMNGRQYAAFKMARQRFRKAGWFVEVLHGDDDFIRHRWEDQCPDYVMVDGERWLNPQAPKPTLIDAAQAEADPNEGVAEYLAEQAEIERKVRERMRFVRGDRSG